MIVTFIVSACSAMKNLQGIGGQYEDKVLCIYLFIYILECYCVDS